MPCPPWRSLSPSSLISNLEARVSFLLPSLGDIQTWELTPCFWKWSLASESKFYANWKLGTSVVLEFSHVSAKELLENSVTQTHLPWPTEGLPYMDNSEVFFSFVLLAPDANTLRSGPWGTSLPPVCSGSTGTEAYVPSHHICLVFFRHHSLLSPYRLSCLRPFPAPTHIKRFLPRPLSLASGLRTFHSNHLTRTFLPICQLKFSRFS